MEMATVIIGRDLAVLLARMIKATGGDTQGVFRCGSCGEPLKPHGDSFGHVTPRPKHCEA